jgi:hypothetical protein
VLFFNRNKRKYSFWPLWKGEGRGGEGRGGKGREGKKE